MRGGVGQMVDVALYESVFNMMESLLPEYSVFGAVRGDFGWVLEDNGPMRSIADVIDAKVSKTYRIYERAL